MKSKSQSTLHVLHTVDNKIEPLWQMSASISTVAIHVHLIAMNMLTQMYRDFALTKCISKAVNGFLLICSYMYN